MLVLSNDLKVNLNDLTRSLNFMKINELSIFYIDDTINKTNVIKGEGPNKLSFIEINKTNFIEFINNPNTNFLEYNKSSLYILKDSNYIDVKILFNKINQCEVNVGRGGGQKAHVLSPLDFRLSCYLMAITNFSYKQAFYLNSFNLLNKSSYLPYINKFMKK